MDTGQRDILLRFAHLLEKHEIPYVLTGSFAVSYYGRPRATHDIDFVVEVLEVNYHRLKRTFSELPHSYLIDYNQIVDALKTSSQFNILHPESGIKIDFWLSNRSDFESDKFRRMKEVIIDRQKVKIISAEDLILNKLLWCREIKSERHMRDCVGIWQVQKGNLDEKYLNVYAKKLGVKELMEEIQMMQY